jgi:mannose-6-phosphate isomerase-like protein (cupin superfamily)
VSRYFPKQDLSWAQVLVQGVTLMDKSIVWEGDFDVRSGFFRMPAGMTIPTHCHTKWVQVAVMEGEMEIETAQDGVVRIAAGGCYFVEPGERHKETAVQDSLVLVTQGEDRPGFPNNHAAVVT